jgi:hypothetical protein
VIRDRVILGMVAGLVGNTVKDISDAALNRSGFGKGSYWQLGTELMAGKQYTGTPMGKAVGHLTDAVIGSALGVVIVYALSLTGRDYYAVKGAGAGTLGWLMTFGILGSISRGLRDTFPVGPQSAVSGFANHALFGATTALVAVRLGDSGLFGRAQASQPVPEALQSLNRVPGPIGNHHVPASFDQR